MRRSPDAYFKQDASGDPNDDFFNYLMETITTIQLVSEWVYSEWELYNETNLIQGLVSSLTTVLDSPRAAEQLSENFPVFKRAYNSYINKNSNDIRDLITFLYKYS
jgi:hypothetical protein